MDRLYVNLPDGTAVAWVDRPTKTVTIKVPKYREEALALLRQHLGTGVTFGSTSALPASAPGSSTARPSSRPKQPTHPRRGGPLTPLPAPPPGDDLARNHPGAGVLGLIAERGPTPAQRLWAKVLRRPSEWDSWYTGLDGERRVGRELERLASFGWHVLHGVPKNNGGDIDHLLIGPGGVFSLNTKTHPGAAVWVGDTMAKVNGGKPVPYAAASRAEADYVQGVLGKHCGFAVPVEPVLVFVGVASLDRAATQYTVRIYQSRDVAALGPLTGKLTSEQVEHVFSVARHRRIWLKP
ncbi:nuclease-related domain-containing protein [Streptomyces achromogenes]|uniref:nuclease-related domain-containing protein n=1 Tax=Streptomyces achromogenes TaxID=67255 RepID=UPI003718A4B5